MTDYFVLRDELYCYKAADLAYIEVVAAGEKRKRTHETKTTIEDFSEQETTMTRKEERDHQVAERFNLQAEVNKTVERDMNANTSVTVTANYAKIHLNNTTTVGAHLSRTDSERVAQEKSRELVDRSVMSIQEQVRTLRSRRVTVETAESNKHIFDNASGTSPKVTKYFWVTQQKRRLKSTAMASE